MKSYYIILLGLIFPIYLLAQENEVFEKKAIEIANKIEEITKEEESVMKKSIEKVEKQYDKKEISKEEYEQEKKRIAEYHAQRINEAIVIQEKRLNELVKRKANGQLLNEPEDSINVKFNKRWTTQVVLAVGANTAQALGVGEEHLKTAALGFFEFGVTWKYRLLINSNFANLKFGFSLFTDEIRLEDNRVFEDVNNQTSIVESNLDIDKVSLLNLYVNLPLHFEFDFSQPKFSERHQKDYYLSQESFRFGIGGFVGFRFVTNQRIRFDDNGDSVQTSELRNFNVEDVVYGPSAYIGYKDLSLYFKYNASELFRHSPTEINYLSIGLRLDWD